MRKIDNNPFSFESYLLRDAQRIVAEICERREHKIANSAVMNVQRAYQLFKESKSKDSGEDNQITVPMNSTPEEESLYLELVDSIVKYRKKLTAPLMSYIQKNQGNHSDILTQRVKTKKSPESLNIDALLSDAMAEPMVDEPLVQEKTTSKIKSNDFEDQIFERFGSEPSRRSNDKNNDTQKDDVSKAQDDENVETNNIPATTSNKSQNPIQNTENDRTSEKIPIKTLMIIDELPSIVGVDKNIYGPVVPQDLITIPEPNARILVKNKKGIFIQTYK